MAKYLERAYSNDNTLIWLYDLFTYLFFFLQKNTMHKDFIVKLYWKTRRDVNCSSC